MAGEDGNVLTAATQYNANKTTSEGVAPLFQPVLNRYLIRVAKPNLVFAQFGQKTKVPRGRTKTVAWDKYTPLPLAKTPLTEGVVPTGASLTVTRATGTPSQYGNYVSTTDEFDFYKHDPSPEVLKIGEMLGDNMAETFDSLTCDVVAAGTNVQYANGKTARYALTSSDKITLAEIKKAVRTLKNNKARQFNKRFICIVDPATAYDIQNDTDWKNVKYRDPKDMYEGEIGDIFGVRFIETTETSPDLLKTYNTAGYINLKTASTVTGALEVVADNTESPTSTQIKISNVTPIVDGSTVAVGDYVLLKAETDIHFVYLIGEDAYGVTDTQENCETITKDKSIIGGPLNQWSTMGWKGHHLAKILVNEWLVRIECGVSA